MGLLEVLDHHAEGQSDGLKQSEEVEYRLVSWGEIYAPFQGDRKHSIYGRMILPDFPMKLFSSTPPYAAPPQRLCLSFRTPVVTKPGSNVTGTFSEEAATEFAAFLSVLTRRRVFAGHLTRMDGWPIEEKLHTYDRSHSQERQRPKEVQPKDILALLESLRRMESDVRERFVLALRLYHTAVEMLYTEPEFSYLFLVTCLEAIASSVNKSYEPKDKLQYLNGRFPKWDELQKHLPADQKSKLIDVLLSGNQYIFRKLAKFVQDYVPECFWTETEDDAKPDYWTKMIVSGPDGHGQEQVIQSDMTLNLWERIEKANLVKVLQQVYDARSKLVHSGVRFTRSIVIGHFSRIPAEAASEGLQAAAKGQMTSSIPPLLTFEKLVSQTLVNFLQICGSGARENDLNGADCEERS